MDFSELDHAIALLDMLCQRTLGSHQVSWLPGACVAACAIVKKTAHRNPCIDVAELKDARAGFANVLRMRHELDEKVVDKPFHLQEVWALHWLNWQIHVPTVAIWLAAFCGRFDIATGGFLTKQLVWAHQKSTAFAWFVLHYVTTFEI